MFDKDLLIRGEDILSVDVTEGYLYDTKEYYVKARRVRRVDGKLFEKLPKKYIINSGATILFWEDDSKTIVKRGKNDNYDKVTGFLWAYFQKTSGLSKTKANKYLQNLVDEDDLMKNN